jgi:hypothetical protein
VHTDTIKNTICVSGWTKTVRPPVSYTNNLKQEQLKGRADRDPTHYEEDHWIPLELGGAPKEPRNLWPELWNDAHKKDKVENSLHQDVCSGKMSLTSARQVMYRQWSPKGESSRG